MYFGAGAGGGVWGAGTASAIRGAWGFDGWIGSPWHGCAPYAFDPFWSLPRWPVHYGGWFGGCGPWWGHYGFGGWCGYAWPSSGFFYGGWSHHRWHVGFGFGCGPAFYSDCHYPIYRCYRYYPYYYYSATTYYPVYGTTYYADAPATTYVDASDPYVEFVDDHSAHAPAGPRPGRLADPPLPAVFAASLHPDVPAGLDVVDYLGMAEKAFREGRYLEAAEALRRSWEGAPDDSTRPLELGYALFAAERYDLAAAAFRAAFATDATLVKRYDSVAAKFGSAEAFRDARLALERRVVREPTDFDARFVFATVAFMNGDWFVARDAFEALGTAEASASAFRSEAERRLLYERR
ncbi:MAG TPA: hypothetical protein VEI02_03000 [Planctomycetota bacterium]|nr:hypothetical protein [Planctomycetota bacterium]